MRKLLLLVGFGLAVAAPPARADVLVNRPDPVLRCGGHMRLGVWYRDFPTKGHRTVTAEVRSARGFVLSRRTLAAPSEWRYWSYTPRCGRHYTVRYVTFAGTSDFRVWVKHG
jgi:hypothetical protein